MTLFLLDTSALLTLRDDQPGADVVASLLQIARRTGSPCLVCFISLMELYYRVWQDEGRVRGRLAYEQCLSLPIARRSRGSDTPRESGGDQGDLSSVRRRCVGGGIGRAIERHACP